MPKIIIVNSKRFTVTALNSGVKYVKDKHNHFPLDDYPLDNENARKLADWLNENVKDYHWFELKEYLNRLGNKSYCLYDNELGEKVKFAPLIRSNNPKMELLKYVDWLNSLVEGSG